MNKLIIINSSYKPNEAATNRLLSLVKGFVHCDVDVQLVFVYPNKTAAKIPSTLLENVEVCYLWDSYFGRNKLYKYIRSFIDVKHFIKKVDPCSNILLIGSSEYLPIISRRRDLHVFQERTEHPSVNPLRPKMLQHIYLKTCKRLDGMFTISTCLQRCFMELGVPRVEIANMTVDISRFDGIEKQNKTEKYIAYCGTASNNKDGVDDLIKAFAIVHCSFPDVKLYIIGKAPAKEDSAGNLELVERLGLTSFVVFTGIIPASEIPKMLVNAKILALARPDSLQARCGFPTKLGEYLLSGNLVVVTRVGDIPLFLEDGKSALLSEPRSPQAFAEKIMWALCHEDEANAIGQAGREVALRHFNYTIEAEKIIKTIFQGK